jgi:hypothetical protein
MGIPLTSIDPTPADSMDWVAQRPQYAPLTSERGLIMPDIGSAIDRFAATLGV